MKSFFKNLFLFSLFVAAADYCWQHFMGEQFPVSHLWQILAFFMAATTAFHFLSMKAAKGAPKNFVRFYIGATALRLFIYILIILVYGLLIGSETIIPFALAFLLHYFVFAAFEVVMLSKQLKEN